MITGTPAFMVRGDPMPKGSMKCIGARGKVKHQLIEGNTPSEPWRELVTDAAARWVSESADDGQPILLVITYSLARPAYHYGTGRNAGRVKPAYERAFPVQQGTGDIDKLERAILDAIQVGKRPLHNDAQVCDVAHKKRFVRGPVTEPPRPDHADVLPVPGVVIRIYPLGEDDV